MTYDEYVEEQRKRAYTIPEQSIADEIYYQLLKFGFGEGQARKRTMEAMQTFSQ